MRQPTLEQAIEERLHDIRAMAESGVSEMTGKLRYEGRYGSEGQRGEVVGRFGGLNIRELQRAGVSPGAAAQAIRRGSGKVFERIEREVRSSMEREGFRPAKKRTRGQLTVAPHPRLTKKCRVCEVEHSKGEHRFHGSGAFHQTHLFGFGGGMKNPGRGKAFTFHGSFTSKILAARREREIPGSFIHAKNGRYYVLKPRKIRSNPQRKRNPSSGKRMAQIYGRVLRIEAQKTGKHRCDAECKKCRHRYFHNFKTSPKMFGLSPGDVIRVPAGVWPIIIWP